MQIETESILKLLITTCNNKKEPVSSKNDDEIQNLNTFVLFVLIILITKTVKT